MDDQYVINAAKTELREGYHNADVERILALFADGFTDMSEGQASFYGADAKLVLRARLENLFREHRVELAPIIFYITIAGEIAIECGWHVMTLRPRAGGPQTVKRTRYIEAWTRDAHRAWHIVLFIDNIDQKPELAEKVVRTLSATAARQEHS